MAGSHFLFTAHSVDIIFHCLARAPDVFYSRDTVVTCRPLRFFSTSKTSKHLVSYVSVLRQLTDNNYIFVHFVRY